MKKTVKITVAFIILAAVLFWTAQSKNLILELDKSSDQAMLPSSTPAGKEIAGMRLNNCSEQNLRIHFLCDFAWRDQNENSDVVFYAINANPVVKLKIAKIPIEILYIQELSREKLEAIGQYMQGFAVEDTEVAGYSALKIKAFSSKDPQIRLLDYYFVRDNNLYTLMFSVNPKGDWNDYKFLFREIVRSFTFD